MPGRNSEYKLAIRIAGEIDKTFPKSMQHSKAELRAIAREASVASSQMGKSIRSGFRDPLNETKGIFTAIEKAGTKAFKAVAKASVTAGAAVGAFSVKTGMDYEKQMSTVKAISKASASDSKKLQDEAKRIGATTASTAKEAGQAMEYEAMAGWKPDQIVEATAAIVDLKQSSDELDLATTSDILTDGITAFKMKAKDATHMADVLAASSTSANTDVAKMGESFKYAAPMAGSLGYTVEDTALNLGLMANAGIKSSMAGTTERSWISRMAKPTKESEQAMKDLGLSLTDKKGKEKSLLQITEETRKAFSDLKKNEKVKYAAMLAGKPGMSGLLGIVNTSEKDFKALKDAIYDCDGAAEELAKTKLDNLAGDVTLLTSATQGAGIEIYEEIKEPLRDLVQGATEWVGDFAEGFKTSFPTIVREAKEAGEAIADFAEPVLKVGEWMIDNPDVIAGTIAGIGTAVAAHKVVGGVSALASGLGALGAAAGPLLGFVAVAGVVAGIGTAVAIAGKQARDASLDRHFGDIALSMEEVQRVSKEIVGAKKLAQVDELFQSMQSVEDVAKAMKSAKKEFSTIEWKLSAGLKLSKSDMDSFETSVKEYVDQSQELISKKGYEVNVATKVLFGDSKEGNNLIKDNNKFFADLDMEAKGLSDRINKKLEKAMKDGLNPDLEKEINGLLEQLSGITNRINKAEEETSWQMLKDKWSGKDLDADSFKNVIKEAQENANELKKGAEGAKQSALVPLNDKKLQGEITEVEYNKELAKIDEAYKKQVSKADSRVSDFLYNTIMDTYGQDLKSGTLSGNDWNGLMDIVETVEGSFSTQGKLGQLVQSLKSIDIRTDEQVYTSIPDIFNKKVNRRVVLMDDKMNGRDVLKESGETVKGLTKDYFTEKYKPYVEEMQKTFGSKPLDFKELLKNPAKEAGKDAAGNAVESMTKGIKSDMAKGVDVKTDIRLQGSYSLTPTEQTGFGVTLNSTKAKQPVVSKKKKSKKAKPYASGGIATEPVLYVAEAGTSESIIPLNGSPRSIDLWKKTGDILGVTGRQQAPAVKPFSELLSELTMLMPAVPAGKATGGEANAPVNFYFSPHITINGDADENVIHKATEDEYPRFKKMMKQWEKDKKRVALKGG